MVLVERDLSSSLMFNSPRPSQRYAGTNSNGGFGGSFVDTNPLSNSVYDEGLDPWSSAPSPAPTPIPQAPAPVFSAVIGDLFCRYRCLFETVMHRS